MSCTICNTRKEKRFCPALHARICPQCCGKEREVTLDCPSTCEYLQQARRNDRPPDLSALSDAELFSQVQIRENFIYEREPLVIGLTYTIVKTAHGDRSIHDRDAIGALTTLARSYQTLVGSGLHYQQPTTNLPQQAIAGDLQKMIAEYRKNEEKHIGYATLKDSEALQALVFILRMAHARTSGRPKSRAFLDFLSAQFPEREASLLTPSEAGGNRLIVP